MDLFWPLGLLEDCQLTGQSKELEVVGMAQIGRLNLQLTGPM